MTDDAIEGSMAIVLKQNHVSMHLIPKLIINRKKPNVPLKCCPTEMLSQF